MCQHVQQTQSSRNLEGEVLKVLFIGAFHDGTGYSHMAISTVLAMDRAGLDVCCRTLKFNNVNGEVHQRITELERKSVVGCDVVIQNFLPITMEYHGGLRNVG